MKRIVKKAIAAMLIGAISIVGFVSCQKKAEVSSTGGEKKTEKKTIKLGSSPGPYDVLFKDAVKPILEAKGYTVESIDFSELQLSNVAISEGSVDFNVSQHSAYMNVFNKNKGTNLAALTPIPTVPAGIFSDKHASLNDVKSGAKVAVPQDSSNTARALALLQKAGWIKLKEGVQLIKATTNDIVENKHKLEIIPMDSTQIPRVLSDVDFAIIPGSVVYASKLDPKKTLLSEDVLKELQLVVVVDEKNKDAQWAKDIKDAYLSDEFKEYMKEHNKDNYWFIPDELK
ncbi:MetQ/NlpA family ABC transporter substrate-binding protein [Clostridium cylindrosporum]|uniref:D-methionine-binding lipoprotein MetQ n=1 Tax=Clostridium cylindrosporum DSM 605 TaxID=1121307 RepID=A0A0J8DDW4_CLOCY|nr:MetQ/NlpA family ABC transporter substrate-binding protein [Clostridium cylindrosporum]KMT22413.1 D-methionine-binding lipoprotein MetQ [Clostridium cylindrosporum DSM 605]